jgi:hypothetical protein
MKLKVGRTLAAIAALSLHIPSFAETSIIQPGMYEVTVGVAGNNMSAPVCYRDKDTQNIESLVLTLEDKLMRKDCTVGILEKTQSSADWTLECKSRFVTRTTAGSIAWTEDSFKGQSVRTMGTVKMESPFEAKRTGDCK